MHQYILTCLNDRLHSDTLTDLYLATPQDYVGFTSDVNITSISFQATAGLPFLDNFRFGTANVATASVPEPFTVIGTLVGGTAALRMRKKLKSARK